MREVLIHLSHFCFFYKVEIRKTRISFYFAFFRSFCSGGSSNLQLPTRKSLLLRHLYSRLAKIRLLVTTDGSFGVYVGRVACPRRFK